MNHMNCAWLIVVATAIPGAIHARADEISFNGKHVTRVYLRESSELYYVQFPESGAVECVKKVDASDITITANDLERKALLDEWKAKQAALKDKRKPSVSIEDLDNPRPRAPQPYYDAARGIKEHRVEKGADGTVKLTVRGSENYDPVDRAQREADEISRHAAKAEARAEEADARAEETAARKAAISSDVANRQAAMADERDRLSQGPTAPVSKVGVYAPNNHILPVYTNTNTNGDVRRLGIIPQSGTNSIYYSR